MDWVVIGDVVLEMEEKGVCSVYGICVSKVCLVKFVDERED